MCGPCLVAASECTLNHHVHGRSPLQIEFETADVDTSQIAFVDPNREKQRQRRLEKDREAMEVRAHTGCRRG